MFGYTFELRDFNLWKLETSPELSSTRSHHEYDAFLNKRSIDDYQRFQTDCQTFQNRAQNLLSEAPGDNPWDEFYLKMIQYEGQTCVNGIESKAYLFSLVDYRQGLQYKLPYWFQQTSFFEINNVTDYNNVLSRLSQIPRNIEDIQNVLKEAIAQNMTLSEESLQSLYKQYEIINVEQIEDSAFYFPLRNISFEKEYEFITRAIQNEAKEMIKNEIIPAFTSLNNFINETYMNHLRPGPGLVHLPNGKELYQKCLEFQTTVKGLTAEEIHQIGLDEVKSLKENVAQIAKDLGQEDLSFKEFTEKAGEKFANSFANKEEVLQFVTELVEEKINPVLHKVIPNRFLTEKLYKLQVKATEPGSGGIAYYVSASPDGKRNGTYYINLDRIDYFAKFELMSLTLHEASPGHHFERSVFSQAHPFPKFMLAPSLGNEVTVPSGIPFYTAFKEGWGLYSEYLGLELGLYEDPYDLLGYYSLNLLRAARLVVDTGIHHYGWTRQEAIDYLVENTITTPFRAEAQIDRYITFPGQATSYKIGEKKILEMRAMEEERLGDDFDLPEFHAKFLACRGPLDMLEECFKLQKI